MRYICGIRPSISLYRLVFVCDRLSRDSNDLSLHNWIKRGPHTSSRTKNDNSRKSEDRCNRRFSYPYSTRLCTCNSLHKHLTLAITSFLINHYDVILINPHIEQHFQLLKKISSSKSLINFFKTKFNHHMKKKDFLCVN